MSCSDWGNSLEMVWRGRGSSASQGLLPGVQILSKTDTIRCAFKGPFWSPVQNGWEGGRDIRSEVGTQVEGEDDPNQEGKAAGVRSEET